MQCIPNSLQAIRAYEEGASGSATAREVGPERLSGAAFPEREEMQRRDSTRRRATKSRFMEIGLLPRKLSQIQTEVGTGNCERGRAPRIGDHYGFLLQFVSDSPHLKQ